MTDLTFLRQFTEDNPEKMKKYIKMFVMAAPGMMETMEKAISAGDYDTVRITAHSLKPQISYMGISSQEQAIKDIESYAGTRTHTEKLPAMMSSFKADIEKAITYLNEQISKL